MPELKDLFDFMLERIKGVGEESGLEMPQAFAQWFVDLYYEQTSEVNIPDGAGDGKIDVFFKTSNGDELRHHVLNAKFTKSYNAMAPPDFYSELTRFWQAFANKNSRGSYLKTVRPALKPRYRNLFEHYDKGHASLAFVCNHRKNEKQVESLKNIGVDVFHLEDILQFMMDYIEGAMPHSRPMTL